jgi:hypothetical protein
MLPKSIDIKALKVPTLFTEELNNLETPLVKCFLSTYASTATTEKNDLTLMPPHGKSEDSKEVLLTNEPSNRLDPQF